MAAPASERVGPRAVAVGGVPHGLSWPLAVGAALAAGVAVRIWLLRSPLATLDSDEAVGGLMSRHVLEGDVNVFFWLSYYAGTQEILLTAPLFALFGSSVLVLKLVPLALYAAATAVTWRVGIRTVGEPAARVGAALMWLWPPFFVFWTIKRSSYPTALLCGVVVLLFALRLYDRRSRRDALVLGGALGCGVWATPQVLLIAAPTLVWLVVRRRDVVRDGHYVAAGAAVGAAPWIAWNVTHGFKAVLPVDSVAGRGSTYLGRLEALFTTVLPEWLGLRLAYSLDWIVARPVGVAATLAAVAAFAWAVVRHRRRTEPLLAIGIAFPFLYAASSFTYFTDEPRYLVFLAPVGALLLGQLATTPFRAAAMLGTALVLTSVYLVRLEDQGRFRFMGQPDNIGPLIRLLEREGENRVFANYWIAYRLGFESEERIIATSTGFVRNAEYDSLVKAAPDPAYVYVEGSAADDAARPRLEARGYRRLTTGGWTAYVRR